MGWHTDFADPNGDLTAAELAQGRGWQNSSETRRGHGMWFYLNGSHPRRGGVCERVRWQDGKTS